MHEGSAIVVNLQPIMGRVIVREITGEIITICPAQSIKSVLNYLLNERS